MTICGRLCSGEEFQEQHPPLTKATKLEKLTRIKQDLLELEDRKLENGQIVRLLEEEIRKLQIKLAVKPSYNAYLLSRAADTSYWVSSNPELYKTMVCYHGYHGYTEDSTTLGYEEGTDCDSLTNWSDLSENISPEDMLHSTTVSTTTTPVSKTTTPVCKTTTPVCKTTTPVCKTTTPVSKTTTPVSKRKLMFNQNKPGVRPQRKVAAKKSGVAAVQSKKSAGASTTPPPTVGTDVVHHLLTQIKEQEDTHTTEKRGTSVNSSATLSYSSMPNRLKCAVQVTHSRNVTGFFTDYSLYHCTLHTGTGQVLSQEKRYSDFVSLRESLIKHFFFLKPHLPEFPEKKVVGKLKDNFIKQRQQGLADFLDSVYRKPNSTAHVNKHIEMWLTTEK